MGYIRGKHTSPGIYTRITSVNSTTASLYERIKPLSTTNINIPVVSGCFSYIKSGGIGYLCVNCENVAKFVSNNNFVISEGHGRIDGDVVYLN